MGGILICVPLTRKPRLRGDAKVQGYTASEWQSEDSDLGIWFQSLCSIYYFCSPASPDGDLT